MARFNEILTGRHNRFMQKYFGLKGGPPAPQLSSEVQPTFELEAATTLENRFGHSWRVYGALAVAAAGGAGNRSAVFLRNPAGSNVVAVVEKITIATGAAFDTPNLTRTQGPANPTAGVAAGSRDNRQVGTSTSLFGSSVNGGAVNGFILWQGSAPTANNQLEVILTHNQELVLMPGDLYAVWSSVLNQAIAASFFWRERALEEGEFV